MNFCKGLALAFLLLSAPLRDINAAQTAFETLLQAANKEDGKLFYGTDVGKKEMQPILDAFMKEFPFVKKIDYHRHRAEDTKTVAMEMAAGAKSESDVTTVSPEFVNRYTSAGWVKKPPIPYKDLAASLPPGWPKPRPVQFHPEGYSIAAAGYLRGIAYNNKKIAQAEAPKNWEDCLNPKWKGKVVYDPRLKLAGLMLHKREWFTNWLKKLVANGVVLGRDQTGNLEMVASGELFIFCGVNVRSTMVMIDKGVNTLTFVLPDPYVYDVGLDGFIMRDSTRPYTATLLSIWLATKGLILVDKYVYDGFTWIPGARLYEAAKGKEGVACDIKCRAIVDKLSIEHNQLLGIPVAK